jgi:hypothetical protein
MLRLSLLTPPVQQAIGFPFDHGITLARELLELGAVEHGDLPAVVLDYTEFLELAGGVGDAFTPDAEHVGDEFLCHD